MLNHRLLLASVHKNNVDILEQIGGTAAYLHRTPTATFHVWKDAGLQFFAGCMCRTAPSAMIFNGENLPINHFAAITWEHQSGMLLLTGSRPSSLGNVCVHLQPLDHLRGGSLERFYPPFPCVRQSATCTEHGLAPAGSAVAVFSHEITPAIFPALTPHPQKV